MEVELIMRKFKGDIKIKILFHVIFLISLIVYSTSATADTITIVADNWCPYNCEPNSLEPGYGIEISEHVFEVAGHEVKYEILPWDAAIQKVREGKYNSVIGASKEDAPDFVFPEEEFGISKVVFFAKKGSSWRFEGLQSLSKVKIGLVKNYSYGQELDKFFQENQNMVQYAYGDDPYSINIKKLLEGKIDVTVEDPYVILLKAKRMGVGDQIIKVGEFGSGQKLYIAFSPVITKSKEYAAILTKGIKKLRDSGELDKILAKYGLEDWK